MLHPLPGSACAVWDGRFAKGETVSLCACAAGTVLQSRTEDGPRALPGCIHANPGRFTAWIGIFLFRSPRMEAQLYLLKPAPPGRKFKEDTQMERNPNQKTSLKKIFSTQNLSLIHI